MVPTVGRITLEAGEVALRKVRQEAGKTVEDLVIVQVRSDWGRS